MVNLTKSITVHVVTSCSVHGTIEAPDAPSAAFYAGVARSYIAAHDYESNWYCCPRVRVLA